MVQNNFFPMSGTFVANKIANKIISNESLLIGVTLCAECGKRFPCIIVDLLNQRSSSHFYKSKLQAERG